MEDQQRTQQLLPEKNGRHPQPVLPVYTPIVQEQKTDEWDVRQFLAVVRRRGLVIGSVAIAICATVWTWTLSRQAVYEGNFGLLVEPVTGESNLAGLGQVPGGSSRYQREGLDYDTQILVLRSSEIMAPIVQQISTRYPDVSYGSLMGNMKISRFQETKILEVSYKDSDPQKIQFILEQLSKGYLKYSVQQRQQSLGQGIQFVDFQLPQLRGRVNSLQIQMQGFREQYNLIAPEDKAGLLYQKASNLEQQRLDTQKQLAEARRFYAALQGRSGAQLAMQAESGSLDMTSPAASSAQSTASSALSQTAPSQAESEEVQNSNGSRRSSSEIIKSAPGNVPGKSSAATARNEGSLYQSLMAQVRQLDSQIALESSRFQADSPHIQALKQKRANLLPVLQQEAKRALGNKLVEVANQIAALETRTAKITREESSLNQQVKQLPNLARRYTDLQRELRIATESLNRFLEKREVLQVEAAQKVMPWQIIASPQAPTVPISPNVQRNLILGAIAGLLAGIAAATLLERLDNDFHSAEDLKELTKLPLLGVIPFQKHLKQLAFRNESTVETPEGQQAAVPSPKKSGGYSYFPFVEAFRSLYTNIGFLGSDTPIHSLVVSSSHQGDGKSTVALHLAEAAAAMGRRVLVVDADLRRPQVHRQLGLPNELGLSNIISANMPFTDVIQRLPSSSDCFVLTSGQLPPDPIKLLSSKKMQNLMYQLRQEFDLVIYDTPPLLGFSDGSLLATNTDGMVLVVRMGKTDRSAVMRALDGLKLSRACVLGTVFNSVTKHEGNAYNYYYRYGSPNAATE